MGWLRELPKIVERDGPILLDLGFDPGLSGLRNQFSVNARDAKPHFLNEREELLDAANGQSLRFNSTAEFCRIIEKARLIDPRARDRIHVLSEFGQDTYDEFFIGRSKEKMVEIEHLFNFMNKAKELSAAEQREFWDDMDERRRALRKPKFALYSPRKYKNKLIEVDDQKTYADSNRVLINGLTYEGTNNKKEDPFVGIFAVHALGNTLRKMIVHPKTTVLGSGEPKALTGIISTPYIHRPNYKKAFEKARMGETGDKPWPMEMIDMFDGKGERKPNVSGVGYGLVILPVRGSKQICTNMPEAML